jgi:hypothetical protein
MVIGYLKNPFKEKSEQKYSSGNSPFFDINVTIVVT